MYLIQRKGLTHKAEEDECANWTKYADVVIKNSKVKSKKG